MKRSVNKKGFTLMEILMSTAIFVLIIGMVSTIFIGTMNYWKRGYSLATRQQAARTLISRMTSNISSLFFSVSRGIYCFGSKDKFYFISVSTKGAEGDLSEIGYEYSPSDSTMLFSYEEKSDFDFDTYDSKGIMAIGVLSVDFSYLDKEGNWRQEWDSRIGGEQEGVPPQAVRVSFAIENTDFTEGREIFETMVELPISN
ncbi:type II secretion system protein J [Candidatus Omnitrophota bacterium]